MMNNSLDRRGLEGRFPNETGFSLFIKRSIYLLIFCILMVIIPGNTIKAYAEEMNRKEKTQYIIVIDPGHGGDNLGTTENGFTEKEMTLQTAFAMQEVLEQYDGVKVYLTRDTDTDLSLEERAEIAKEYNADFLLSLHYNASNNHNIFGAEIWVDFNAPYQAYGYEYGKIWSSNIQKYGLLLRGIKTRESETNPGTDYYGILRCCAQRDISAVIIEHAHVDEERDTIYIDDAEKIKEFGRIDAYSLAEFLGLNLKENVSESDVSDERMVNYGSDFPIVKRVDSGKRYVEAMNLWSNPEVCSISRVSENYETGKVVIEVSGADFDAPLLYYSYSMDGGRTYSEMIPWPETDALSLSYKDTFHLSLDFPDNKYTRIVVRAHNMFDQYTESNILEDYQIYHAAKETETEPKDYIETVNLQESITPSEEGIILNDVASKESTWSLANLKNKDTEQLLGFILISLFVAFCLIWLVFMLVLNYRHRKRRKNKKK